MALTTARTVVTADDVPDASDEVSVSASLTGASCVVDGSGVIHRYDANNNQVHCAVVLLILNLI